MAPSKKVSGDDKNPKTKLGQKRRVSKIHKEASKTLKAVSEMRTSFKTYIYSKVGQRSQKSVYGLVVETMNYSSIIDELISSTSISKIPLLDRDLAKVLICDLLFREKPLPGNTKLVLKIKECEKELRRALKKLMKKKNAESVTELNQGVKLPVYVRVNCLATSTEEYIDNLNADGYEEKKYSKGTSYEDFIESVKSLKKGQFIRDFHFADLLVFPFGTPFYDSVCYQDGRIIIQDKSSCMAPVVLNPKPGSVVIDACAAPGMKTTQLATLMKNKGQILAVEKDENRFKLLQNNLTLSHVTCATTFCKDFTAIDPTSEPFCNAEYILVDPSCSGSGMAKRLLEGSATKTNNSTSRIKQLSCFQAKCLRHALKFPNVKRVVYSTCSFSTEENEGVVSEVLNDYKGKFQLARALPAWPRRGLKKEFKNMGRAIKTDPDLDLTGGFFVAVIERKEL